MKYRDIVWSCLEMAHAEHHDRSLVEQFHTPGEKAKIVALARCMPKSLTHRLVALKKIDTTPVRSDARITKRPVSYGGESLVYGMQVNGHEYVYKLAHTKTPAEEQLAQSVLHNQMYCRYFGHLVVPTYFMMCESPYGSRSPVVASIQPKISGKNISEVYGGIDQSELSVLLEGAHDMMTSEGVAPDIGRGNVKVNVEGHIKLVDTGYLVPLDELDAHDFQDALSHMESLQEPGLQAVAQ